MELLEGHFVSSPHLFSIAHSAYDRARQDRRSDRDAIDGDPLVSILFAAAAVEAFINELGELAAAALTEGEQSTCATLATSLTDAETSKATAGLKYQLAKMVLSGEAFSKGAAPYQDFDALISLRNALVHLKFEKVKVKQTDTIRQQYPAVVEGLKSRNLTAVFEKGETIASWITIVSTPAVARWACNAATAMVREVIGLVPDGTLKLSLGQHYKFGFQKV